MLTFHHNNFIQRPGGFEPANSPIQIGRLVLVVVGILASTLQEIVQPHFGLNFDPGAKPETGRKCPNWKSPLNARDGCCRRKVGRNFARNKKTRDVALIGSFFRYWKMRKWLLWHRKRRVLLLYRFEMRWLSKVTERLFVQLDALNLKYELWNLLMFSFSIESTYVSSRKTWRNLFEGLIIVQFFFYREKFLRQIIASWNSASIILHVI